MVTVLLRPFPWEVARLAPEARVARRHRARRRSSSSGASRSRSRCDISAIVPFLFYCWALTILYSRHVPGVRATSVCSTASVRSCCPRCTCCCASTARKAREFDDEQRERAAFRRAEFGPWRRASASVRRTVKVASAAADRLRPDVAGVVDPAVPPGRRRLVARDRPRRGAVRRADRRDRRVGPRRVARRRARAARGAGSRRRRPSSVVVTFDDGTADFVDVAVPILVRHRVPATLYLATAFVEDERRVPRRRAAGVVVRAARRVLDWTGRHRLAHAHAPAARSDLAGRGRRRARPVDRPDRRAPRPARARLRVPEGGARHAATSRALVRDRFRSAALAGTRVNPVPQRRAARATDPYGSRVRRSRSATACSSSSGSSRAAWRSRTRSAAR